MHFVKLCPMKGFDEVNLRVSDEVNRRIRDEVNRRVRDEVNRRLRDEVNRRVRDEVYRRVRENERDRMAAIQTQRNTSPSSHLSRAYKDVHIIGKKHLWMPTQTP